MCVLLLCGCGSHAARREVLHVHVHSAARNLPVTDGCFLLLRSNVVGGLTLNLPTHTIRARVHVTTRFGPDGEHAIQTLRGAVSGGGTIAGGGPYVEAPPGRVGASDLPYTVRLGA
jgi:hypothetical protein